ncbi:two-component system response regulator NarL [Burkholderiaceae bacterium FT117]|uniref:two-component system response regulator NarL n=1 Tax=Zeimonas sediminis TaxID=2944268 RepID=UPI002342CD9D|nr:two-component system response regulator NarL [Zeimonas sediminis]MCM5572350.1 two-component system response regulator NarL [Zeimonas sediminis]
MPNLPGSPAASARHTVVIVDDHPLFRRGLAQLLAMEPALQVVAEAESGEGLAELCRRHEPDLVLLDLNMRGVGGIEALRALKDSGCEARVVILTVSDRSEDLVTAIRAGADGYLLKDMEPEDLLDRIREVLEGRVSVAPALAGSLAVALRGEAVEAERVKTPLTNREQAILRCLSAGMSNKLIARELGIAEGTVKVHVKSLLKKLGFRSRLEAAVWAVERS